VPRPCSREGARGDDRQTDTRSIHYMIMKMSLSRSIVFHFFPIALGVRDQARRGAVGQPPPLTSIIKCLRRVSGIVHLE